ncbi:MAG: RodZ domain-containing protein, partial [Pseudomonadota bacterium]
LVDLIPDFPDRFNALLVQNPESAEPVELAQPGDDQSEVPTSPTDSENLAVTLRSPLEDNTFGSPPPEDPFPTTAQPGEPVEQLASPAPAPVPADDADEGDLRVSGVQPSLTPGFDIPTAPTGLADPLQDVQAADGPSDGVSSGDSLGEDSLGDVALGDGALGESALGQEALGEGGPTENVFPLGDGVPLAETDSAPETSVGPTVAENLTESAPEVAADSATDGLDEQTETAAAPALAEQDLETIPDTPGQSAAIAAARPPGPPTSPTFGGENEDSRVLINATAMSWVQVRDDAGNLVMTRVLQPGESYRVPNRQGLHMVTGNAGGIEIFVDGQPTPPFGRHGDVVRNIDLDPDALLNGTAAPN